ncbi:MAG TPA: hypothetical protein VGH32_13390, partial [Pirellulales bacterium]
RLLMDALAKAASPAGSDLADERFEHLHLFNLIGDPLTALRFPKEMAIKTNRSAVAGETIAVSGQSPCDGRCTIELVSDHDDAGVSRPRQNFDNSDAALADYQKTYRQINHPPLATIEAPVEQGKFAATLFIPANTAGRCKIRAFVAGNGDCAAGSTTVEISPPRAAPK